MKRITRRDFSQSLLMVGGLASLLRNTARAQKAPSSIFQGVQIGLQSYSFRDRSLEAAINAMTQLGINSCELWQGHLEPQKLPKEELRKWRLDTPLSFFKDAGQQLRKAGIQLSAYYYDLRKEMTDLEIDRGFLMTKALGANAITTSSSPSMAKRIDSFAKQHKVRVGMHNHAQGGRSDEFGGPKDFEEAMNGNSPYICVNLDIGHFVAAGFDPIEYISQHHDRIVTLHIKDRKKGLGPKSPVLKFGTGDTPIKEVLQLLKAKRYKIPANIEHEIEGQPAMEGVKESLEYCKKALA